MMKNGIVKCPLIYNIHVSFQGRACMQYNDSRLTSRVGDRVKYLSRIPTGMVPQSPHATLFISREELIGHCNSKFKSKTIIKMDRPARA
jgi:hypothetical protein